MLGLLTDKGFVKSPNENDGYSTQNKYSRANLRTNLDIDLTSTTKLKLNLLGTLSESSRPGESVDLWDMVYSLPAAAFPIRTEDGSWGGSTTWAGTMNPIAQSQGAAYSKGHTRNLYADLTLSQDLSGFVKDWVSTSVCLTIIILLFGKNIVKLLLLKDIVPDGRTVRSIPQSRVENPEKWRLMLLQMTGHVSLILRVALIIIAHWESSTYTRN